MAVKFKILYEQDVIKEDIPKLGNREKTRIRKSIEQKLISEPVKFGKPLRRSLNGYLKLRVGDHRIVFRIEKKCIKVFAIGSWVGDFKNP